jgi:gas vesicle protein GvpG
MFLLDSLMISGISWTLRTVVTAAEAEMNDDTALREQLLAAEMQRELGEISDDEFADIERDLLARIREIKERRDGGTGPLEFGAGTPIETDDENRIQIEASVSGDFHEPADAPHTTIIEQVPPRHGIIGTVGGQVERVLDIEPMSAETLEETALPLPPLTRARRTTRRRTAKKQATGTKRTTRTNRTARTVRTIRASRTGKIR